MSKDIKEKIRPVVDWFIPYQTKLFKKKVMIVSFQYKHQRKEICKTINKNN